MNEDDGWLIAPQYTREGQELEQLYRLYEEERNKK